MENLKLGKSAKIGEFGCYKPIMSLDKDSLKEMQLFFLLKIVSDNIDGVTAYQLSTDYQFPRSKAIRILEKLETKGYLSVNEQIIAGRTNKMYLLTQDGFSYLIELKNRWSERFSMMEELTSRNITSTEKKYLIKSVEKLKTKEERVDYLNSICQKIQSKLTATETKYATLLKMKDQIDGIIEKIEVMDDISEDDLQRFFDTVNNKEDN